MFECHPWGFQLCIHLFSLLFSSLKMHLFVLSSITICVRSSGRDMIMSDLEIRRGGQCICQWYNPMAFLQMHQNMDIWVKFLTRLLVCEKILFKDHPDKSLQSLYSRESVVRSSFSKMNHYSIIRLLRVQSTSCNLYEVPGCVFFAGLLWMIHFSTLWLVICLEASADGHSITSFLYKQSMNDVESL